MAGEWKSRRRSACCPGERYACRRMGIGGVRRRRPCSEDGQALEDMIENRREGGLEGRQEEGRANIYS